MGNTFKRISLPIELIHKFDILEEHALNEAIREAKELEKLIINYNITSVNPVKNLLLSNVDEIVKSFIKTEILELSYLDLEQQLQLSKKEEITKEVLHTLADIKTRFKTPLGAFIIKRNKVTIDKDVIKEVTENKACKSITKKEDIAYYNKLNDAIKFILNEVPRSRMEYIKLKKALNILYSYNEEITYNGFYSLKHFNR